MEWDQGRSRLFRLRRNTSHHFDERLPTCKTLQDLRQKRSQPVPERGIRGVAQSQPDHRCRLSDECGEHRKVLIFRHDDVSVPRGELEHGTIIEIQARLIVDVNRFMCLFAKPGGEAGREVGVHEELHPVRAGTIL